jgi:hypothetical protein
MSNKGWAWTAIACLVIANSGCATVGKGPNQSIHVGSTPEGAECVFTREGQRLGTVTTPGPITVQRGKAPINVVCTKNGHEDARAVLNSLGTTGAIMPIGLIGLVISAATLVDMASGADTHYQTALMVKLEPLSAADQTAALAAPTKAAMPSAAVTPVQPAPVPTAAATADGGYQGGFSITATAISSMYVLRQVNLHVVGGRGKGTVNHALCSPGTVTLAIDASGTVRGDIDILNNSCGPRTATLEGKVEGDRLVLHLNLDGRIINFTLTRQLSGA